MPIVYATKKSLAYFEPTEEDLVKIEAITKKLHEDVRKFIWGKRLR